MISEILTKISEAKKAVSNKDNPAKERKPYLVFSPLTITKSNIYDHPVSSGWCPLKLESGKATSGSWTGCRETFSHHFGNASEAFLFGCSLKEAQGVAQFMSLFEQKANINSGFFIQLTSIQNCVAIFPGKWWTANLARRQLLTILIRCGAARRGNLPESIDAVEYAKHTNTAIQAFISGKFNISSANEAKLAGFGGWYSTFHPSRIKSQNTLEFLE